MTSVTMPENKHETSRDFKSDYADWKDTKEWVSSSPAVEESLRVIAESLEDRILSQEEAEHFKKALSGPVSTIKAEKLPSR